MTETPKAFIDVTPWPLTAVWLGDHWARDCARFWGRLAGASDPVEAVRAEGDLNVDLIHDWWAAGRAFWLIPLTAWTEWDKLEAANRPPAV